MDSTNIADFIHGHCFLFEDFTFSYLKADKTKHVALCLECFEYPDSVYHKVFECTAFETNDRLYLREKVGHLEHNFHLGIIFHNESEECKQIRAAFKAQITHIKEQSTFKDEFLTRQSQPQNIQDDEPQVQNSSPDSQSPPAPLG